MGDFVLRIFVFVILPVTQTQCSFHPPEVLVIQDSRRIDLSENSSISLTGEFWLQCQSPNLTRWVGQVRAVTHISAWVKERHYDPKGSIVSKLSLSLKSNQNVSSTFFSCEAFEESSKQDGQGNIVCINVSWSQPKIESQITKVSATTTRDCLQWKNTTYIWKPSFNLTTFDLQEKRISCPVNESHVKKQLFQNMDSPLRIYITRHSVLGRLLKLSSESTPTKNLNKDIEKNPFVIFSCVESEKRKFGSSYIPLYAGFNNSSHLNLTYYSNLKEAAEKSILLLGLSSNEFIHWNWNNNKIIMRRTMFAEKETVELACIAKKTLFMKGFQWIINNGSFSHFLNDTEDVCELERNSSLIFAKKNVTFDSSKYGQIKQVVCRGPIWNSRMWAITSLDVNITAPLKPEVWFKIEDIRSNNFDLYLNCTYSGWPLPNVLWNFSREVDIIQNSSWHIATSKTHEITRTSVWHQFVILKRPMNDTTASCLVKNSESETLATIFLYGTHKTDKHERSLVPFVISGFLLLGLLALALMYQRNRRKMKKQAIKLSERELSVFYNGSEVSTCESIEFSQAYNPSLEIPFEQISLERMALGQGEFGQVFKGKYMDSVVAVKTVKLGCDLIQVKSLQGELKILQFVGEHPNIVNLIGANTKNLKHGKIYIVMDYCSKGNLRKFLKKGKESFVNMYANSVAYENMLLKQNPWYDLNGENDAITTMNLLSFAADIASGMEHLSLKNVIHGDLAARNVLVTENLRGKLCDFGLSKMLYTDVVYVKKTMCPLPAKWMAIETIQGLNFSLASDIWSYGICLWEIFTLGDTPYGDVPWSFESLKMLEAGRRLRKPYLANDIIYDIMFKCWNLDPAERPSFEWIGRQITLERNILEHPGNSGEEANQHSQYIQHTVT